VVNAFSRGLLVSFTAMALLSPVAVHARPGTHPSLTQDAALNLLLQTLKRDNLYAGRISLGCISFIAEEKSDAYFEFVLREIHNSKCGGDPNVSPVVDRYRVYRASGKIKSFDPVNDRWRPYNPRKTT
jgi:hypothetical protein